MIDPSTISRADTFKVTKDNGLYDLQRYQDRNTTALKALTGWKKAQNDKLMTPEELRKTEYQLPTVQDNLSLPPLTKAEEKIAELKPGSLFKVVQTMFHTNKAASGNSVNKDKAFQCLLVETKVSGTPKLGFLWSVHRGESFIEKVNEQGKDSQSHTGIEVEVRAGQTTVLNIKAQSKTGQENKGEKVDKNKMGCVEVQLAREDGSPYTGIDSIYLISASKSAIYRVPIDTNTGEGSKKDIIPGKYNLSLYIGRVHFQSGKKQIIGYNEKPLKQLIDLVNKATFFGFEKCICIGYADSDGSAEYNKRLCLERANNVKKYILEKQEKLKDHYINIRSGGMLPGVSKEEKENNRRVDVYGVPSEQEAIKE